MPLNVRFKLLLRRLGLYRGPIHYRLHAEVGRFGVFGKDVG